MFRFTILLLTVPIFLFAEQPNLLLITIDTLRADHLGCYGNTTVKTPNLDLLAKNSLFFENAICPTPLTLPSHTSLMTGRNPSRHGTRDNAGHVGDQELTLAEILKSKGYHTYAFVGGFPLEHRFGLNQGFDLYDDYFPRPEGRPLDFGSERNAEAVVSSYLKITKKEPFFVWIHFYDPHAPYLNGGYRGEIEYVDRQIARVVTTLNRANTFIAVAGDHGEGLGEHKEWTHRIFLYDTTIRVPFFISGPDIQSQKTKAQVRLIDFLPTVLHLMKLQPSPAIDGVILPQDAGKPAVLESLFPQLQLGWSALRGIRTQDWKLIDSPKPELYDLRADSEETQNLFSKRPDIVKALRENLPKESPPKPAEISPEMAEQLASLGYVGGSAPPTTNAPDPKDRIHVWNLIEQAHDLETKDTKKSIALLENARKSDPANPMVLNFLAELYADQRSYVQAKQILQSLLKRDPKNVPALLRIARVSLKSGDAQNALKYAMTLRTLKEGHAETELLIAGAYLKLKNLKAASEHLRNSLHLDPEDHATRIDLGNLYLQTNETEKARVEFETVLKEDSHNLQALNGIATWAYQQKKYDQSEQHLRSALSKNPDDPQTLMNLALVFSTQGKRAEAIRIYRELEQSKSAPPEWRDMARARRTELEP